ncbi:hypothetical protein ACP70R_002720 [Stipagrostis hirtigluma subsp. patula]
MDAYLEQAKQFAEDPGAPLPTAGEDAMEEIMASRQQKKNLDEARDRLVEVQGALEGVLGQANPMVGALRAELQQLLDLMQSPELHQAVGLRGGGAAVAETASHARQRVVGDGGRGAPRRTANVGDEEEMEDNPMAAILGPLAVSIQGAVEALQAVQQMVTAAATAPDDFF